MRHRPLTRTARRSPSARRPRRHRSPRRSPHGRLRRCRTRRAGDPSGEKHHSTVWTAQPGPPLAPKHSDRIPAIVRGTGRHRPRTGRSSSSRLSAGASTSAPKGPVFSAATQRVATPSRSCTGPRRRGWKHTDSRRGDDSSIRHRSGGPRRAASRRRLRRSASRLHIELPLTDELAEALMRRGGLAGFAFGRAVRDRGRAREPSPPQELESPARVGDSRLRRRRARVGDRRRREGDDEDEPSTSERLDAVRTTHRGQHDGKPPEPLRSTDPGELVAGQHEQRSRGAEPGPERDPRGPLRHLADHRGVRTRTPRRARRRGSRPRPRERRSRPPRPRSRRRAGRGRASRRRPGPVRSTGTACSSIVIETPEASASSFRTLATPPRVASRRHRTSARREHGVHQVRERRAVGRQVALELDPRAPGHHRHAVRRDGSGDEHAIAGPGALGSDLDTVRGRCRSRPS